MGVSLQPPLLLPQGCRAVKDGATVAICRHWVRLPILARIGSVLVYANNEWDGNRAHRYG
jgi:hypothetical protein